MLYIFLHTYCGNYQFIQKMPFQYFSHYVLIKVHYEMCLLSWWEKQLLGKGYNYLTHAVSISIFVMIGYKMATTKFILVS